MSLTVLILLLCIFGIFLCLQMAIVLGRLSGQSALWEWQLRGIELTPDWQEQKLVTGLYRLHETRPIEDLKNEPPVFKPNWAFRQHRQWCARRRYDLPRANRRCDVAEPIDAWLDLWQSRTRVACGRPRREEHHERLEDLNEILHRCARGIDEHLFNVISGFETLAHG